MKMKIKETNRMKLYGQKHIIKIPPINNITKTHLVTIYQV